MRVREIKIRAVDDVKEKAKLLQGIANPPEPTPQEKITIEGGRQSVYEDNLRTEPLCIDLGLYTE